MTNRYLSLLYFALMFTFSALSQNPLKTALKGNSESPYNSRSQYFFEASERPKVFISDVIDNRSSNWNKQVSEQIKVELIRDFWSFPYKYNLKEKLVQDLNSHKFQIMPTKVGADFIITPSAEIHYPNYIYSPKVYRVYSRVNLRVSKNGKDILEKAYEDLFNYKEGEEDWNDKFHSNYLEGTNYAMWIGMRRLLDIFYADFDKLIKNETVEPSKLALKIESITSNINTDLAIVKQEKPYSKVDEKEKVNIKTEIDASAPKKPEASAPIAEVKEKPIVPEYKDPEPPKVDASGLEKGLKSIGLDTKEEEKKKLEEVKKLEEAKKLEEKKKQEEKKKLEDARKLEEKKKIEESKKLEETRKKEEEIRITEAKKLEETRKKEEETRIAEAKKLEEAKELALKKANEEAKKRIADSIVAAKATEAQAKKDREVAEKLEAEKLAKVQQQKLDSIKKEQLLAYRAKQEKLKIEDSVKKAEINKKIELAKLEKEQKAKEIALNKPKETPKVEDKKAKEVTPTVSNVAAMKNETSVENVKISEKEVIKKNLEELSSLQKEPTKEIINKAPLNEVVSNNQVSQIPAQSKEMEPLIEPLANRINFKNEINISKIDTPVAPIELPKKIEKEPLQNIVNDKNIPQIEDRKVVAEVESSKKIEAPAIEIYKETIEVSSIKAPQLADPAKIDDKYTREDFLRDSLFYESEKNKKKAAIIAAQKRAFELENNKANANLMVKLTDPPMKVEDKRTREEKLKDRVFEPQNDLSKELLNQVVIITPDEEKKFELLLASFNPIRRREFLDSIAIAKQIAKAASLKEKKVIIEDNTRISNEEKEVDDIKKRLLKEKTNSQKTEVAPKNSSSDKSKIIPTTKEKEVLKSSEKLIEKNKIESKEIKKTLEEPLKSKGETIKKEAPSSNKTPNKAPNKLPNMQ